MLFSKQTPAAGGDAFAQFDAAWCYNGNGYIFNDTGTSLDVRIGDSGSVQTVAAGKTLPIALVFSMAELYVRRTDQSPTQVTVEATVGLNAGASDGGGGGTSGPVASSDITDASASGIVALTSPAALAVAASAKVTLTATSAQVQSLTLTGAQDVELPAESGTWAFVILNTAASTGAATVKRAGGTTVATLAAGDSGLFVFDGVAVGAY